MALNNYTPLLGLLAQQQSAPGLQAAPWSAAGLQAGSGLNRYTNQPRGLLQPPAQQMQPAPAPTPTYQPPAYRSIADGLAQYRAQAAAAAAPAPIQAPPGAVVNTYTGSGSAQAGSSGDGGDGRTGTDSGESWGSQLGNALGIRDIADGARSGYVIGGPVGAILGGLLGHSVAQDQTNPLGVNAVNGADAGFSMASSGPGWSGGNGGLTDAGLSGVEGFGGGGVPTGEALGGTLDGMGGGLGLLGYSAPAPAPAAQPTFTPVVYNGSYNPNGAPGKQYPGEISGYRNSVTGEITRTPPQGAPIAGSAGSGSGDDPYSRYYSNPNNPYSGYQTYGTSEGE